MAETLAETLSILQDWFDQRPTATALGAAGALLIAAIVSYFVARIVLVGMFKKASERTHAVWDDAMLEQNVPRNAALIVPALVIAGGVRYLPDVDPLAMDLLTRLDWILLAIAVGLTLNSMLAAARVAYRRSDRTGDYSIKSYVQLGQLLVWLSVGIVIVAIAIDKSPLLLLSGLGAAMAVLLLVFRSTILGFVAGVQIVGNDMLRLGDWIEMPKFGADGEVVDIALHTVKVQNWDRTITAIPSHKFLEESFKNWRGMQESGGRRIMRSIIIDIDSVRFLAEADVDRLGNIELIAGYVSTMRDKLADETSRASGDMSVVANQPRLTNLGTYRAYVEAYLKYLPDVHKGMTLLVRQRSPGPDGLPLEIYAFASDTEWATYERIQADIFDHLFAIAGEFDLRLFQQPSAGQMGDMLKLLSDGRGQQEPGG